MTSDTQGTTCPRTTPTPPLAGCPTCGALPSEDCPLADMTPGLLESAPVTAGAAGQSDEGDVCEACQ